MQIALRWESLGGEVIKVAFLMCNFHVHTADKFISTTMFAFDRNALEKEKGKKSG